eukprot:scaffold284214_cov28-Tisochrysis_lutea.AAC.2
MRSVVSVVLLLAASALSLQPTPIGAVRRSQVPRASRPLVMEQPSNSEKPAEQITLSDEQIVKAAKAASDPGADPFADVKVEASEAEPFDPRIIVYVSLPALVLLAQLFFTFSRDMMAGDAVGPAIMDLWIQ